MIVSRWVIYDNKLQSSEFAQVTDRLTRGTLRRASESILYSLLADYSLGVCDSPSTRRAITIR
jgi:hypothetical protein